jgi:flagellar protein FlaJ
MHAILIIAADNRTKVVEELLPDMLRLLAANIRSGLTIDKALLVSARPEFGPLERELKIASKETLSGVTIDTALFKICDTFNSKILKRSVELLSEGLKRGGDLAKLLEGLSDDIRQVKILKKDINAMVMMYVIFIFFAAGIGAPLLYSVSGFLVNTMGKIGTAINLEEALPAVSGSIPMGVPKLSVIDPQFLDTYSLISLGVTAVFGGLLIGLVQEGTERAGLRFIPILLVISILIYFVSKGVVMGFFGDIGI